MRICDALPERFRAPSPAPKNPFHPDSRCDETYPLREDAALLGLLVATSHLKRALHHGAAEVLDADGLTISQWMILCHLRAAGAATLTEIAAALRLDAGALSRAANLLQQRQLLTATKIPDDRRSVRLSVSETGSALCRSLGMTLGERVSQTLDAALGEQAMRALLQLMDRAAAFLEPA
jgi:MarR family multiple antibiotic resistance transcriptional regulator